MSRQDGTPGLSVFGQFRVPQVNEGDDIAAETVPPASELFGHGLIFREIDMATAKAALIAAAIIRMDVPERS